MNESPQQEQQQSMAREAARKIMDKQMHRGLVEDVAYGKTNFCPHWQR